MTDDKALVERLRSPGMVFYEYGADKGALLHSCADRIEALTAENEWLRAALTDIGVYGCGMLNQPAAMNGPEEVWLRLRIREMENVARAALGDTQ